MEDGGPKSPSLKKAQARGSELKFQQIFHSSTAIIFRIDPDAAR